MPNLLKIDNFKINILKSADAWMLDHVESKTHQKLRIPLLSNFPISKTEVKIKYYPSSKETVEKSHGETFYVLKPK